MPTIRAAGGSRDLRLLFGKGRSGSLTDGQLLERFVALRDETGEMAFASLVDRHGPMVLRVCRGLLRDTNDAEDAFQATFLVLARRAGSLWVKETIGPWLHGVAYRVATRALSDRARRVRHEQRAAEQTPTAADPVELDDLDMVVHEEVERLPHRFRSPIVLCYFQGLTHDQAASQLGWPVGTVRSRLARGRDRLRDRLDRRGLTEPAELLDEPASKKRAVESIRPSVAVATVRGATKIASGKLAAAGMLPVVETLTKGTLRMMIWNRLLKLTVGVAAAGFVATGVAVTFQASGSGKAFAGAAQDAARPSTPPKSEAETTAETFLKAGADLFDAKNAAALAATFTEDGTIHLISHRDGQLHDDVKQGQADIERFYSELFSKAGAIDSENTVEFVRQIRSDLLVVNGRFRLDVGKPELPFVQMRTKSGDKWLLSKLWLFIDPFTQ